MTRLRAAAGLPIILLIAGQPRIVGAVWSRSIQPGDSLATLGVRFGVEPATLAADNALTLRHG